MAFIIAELINRLELQLTVTSPHLQGSPKHQPQFDQPLSLPNQTNSANLTHTGPLMPHHPAPVALPPSGIPPQSAPFPPPGMQAIPPIMPAHHQGLIPPPLNMPPAQGIPPQAAFKGQQTLPQHLQPPMLPLHATNSANLPQTGPPMPQGVSFT